MASPLRLDITYQTLYSELVQRSLDESFTSEFSSNGRFVAVEVKGKKYWYFDTPKPEGGGQDRRYVGPVDDPKSQGGSRRFKDLKADLKGRRRLVSTLTREAYLARPLPMAGQVVEQLARAGFFRLRGVLVGTIAYQCYSAVLGTRLDAVAMQTGDADFAQFLRGHRRLHATYPGGAPRGGPDLPRDSEPKRRTRVHPIRLAGELQGGVPHAEPVVRPPGREAGLDAGAGRGGGVSAALPRFSDLPADPRRPLARCGCARPHPIAGTVRHPQAHHRIAPKGRSRCNRKELEGPASGQIHDRGDDREPAARRPRFRLCGKHGIAETIGGWRCASVSRLMTTTFKRPY